jgi:hypothetical protein
MCVYFVQSIHESAWLNDADTSLAYPYSNHLIIFMLQKLSSLHPSGSLQPVPVMVSGPLC